ncbi:hypothetical protein [Bradyrhizobium sp. Leo170]|uniref:hypothetical protein n=1 Tax=Bradyrhizobium sp. Leo170 TaxID=1571199 RepID=UPI001FE0D881|nr:hypothetical protein [Bradyrhizobium sp. Leo170]
MARWRPILWSGQYGGHNFPSRYGSLSLGTPTISLRDAANYITALPENEAKAPEWQAAIEALMLVVELDGPTMFARIGMMPALNRHHVRPFNPARKDHHWDAAS